MHKSTADDIDRDETIATPEGDNEFAPDQPLRPLDGLETPAGSAPDGYIEDEPSALEHVVTVIDEVSRGKIQP